MSLYVEGPTSLTDASNLRVDPRLFNKDLAPTTPEQRTWSTYNYIAHQAPLSKEFRGEPRKPETALLLGSRERCNYQGLAAPGFFQIYTWQ